MGGERLVFKKELFEILGFGQSSLQKHRRNGAPDPVGYGSLARWPLYAWAEWIKNRPYNAQQNKDVLRRSIEILKERDETSDIIPMEDRGAGMPSDMALLVEGNEEQGLEAALCRLRQAERFTYVRWHNSSIEDPGMGPAYFKDWQQALDLLRKSEKSLTEYLEQRKDLLPASEIKAWLVGQLTVAKQSLLTIPGKLAPQLENQSWAYIQKRLTEEIRFALEKISSQPGK